MSSGMRAIRKAQPAKDGKGSQYAGTITPNLLPCRIHRDGPVRAVKRYWDPRVGKDGKNVSYFRGRKLYGRGLKIPEGYRGVVLQSTERVLEPKGEQGEQGEQGEEGEQGVEGEDEETAEPEIKVMEEIAEFEEIIVWGHETVVDETDGYVRGVGEWLSWCDSIHSYDDGDKEGEKK